jgi:hypothetical protein
MRQWLTPLRFLAKYTACFIATSLRHDAFEGGETTPEQARGPITDRCLQRLPVADVLALPTRIGRLVHHFSIFRGRRRTAKNRAA